MKFIKRFVPLLLAACVAFAAACSILPFEGKALKNGKVGIEYSDSIATGTKNMYYDLDYDSNLPKGLVLYDDGTITGIPEQAGDFTFKAVMIDMDDNEYYADFTIFIEKGSLSYTSSALKDGKTGEPYLADIATATGMPSITYTVKEGTALPAGLTLSADGELSGIPTAAGEGLTFTVVASAEGCDPVEAVYTVSIAQGEYHLQVQFLGRQRFARWPDWQQGARAYYGYSSGFHYGRNKIPRNCECGGIRVGNRLRYAYGLRRL